MSTATDTALDELGDVLTRLEDQPENVPLLRRQIRLMHQLGMEPEWLESTLRLSCLVMLNEGGSQESDVTDEQTCGSTTSTPSYKPPLNRSPSDPLSKYSRDSTKRNKTTFVNHRCRVWLMSSCGHSSPTYRVCPALRATPPPHLQTTRLPGSRFRRYQFSFGGLR